MNTYSEALEKAYSQTGNFIGPMVKMNKTAVHNLEKVVDFQLKSWHKYVDFGMSQLKAAAEIDGPKALQSFMGQQMESANELRQYMIEDFKSLTELSSEIREDMSKIAEENTKDMKSAANKAAKKAA